MKQLSFSAGVLIRKLTIIFYFSFVTLLVFAQTQSEITPKQDEANKNFTFSTSASDVIVLLDLSASILPYHSLITNDIITRIVQDYLVQGDTFHLISFGEVNQTEIVQSIQSEADLKLILGRLYLLFPLATHTDLIGALNYLYQYVLDLGTNRYKTIIIITDGYQNAPPNNPTYLMSDKGLENEIKIVSSKFKSRGWKISFIKLPAFATDIKKINPQNISQQDAGGVSILDSASRYLGADVSAYKKNSKTGIQSVSLASPLALYPVSVGKKDYAFNLNVQFQNVSDSNIKLELEKILLKDENVLTKRIFIYLKKNTLASVSLPIQLPAHLQPGLQDLPLRLYFANNIRVVPGSATIQIELVKNPVTGIGRIALVVVQFIFILLLGFCLVWFIVIFAKRLLRKVPAGSRVQFPITTILPIPPLDARQLPSTDATSPATLGDSRKQAFAHKEVLPPSEHISGAVHTNLVPSMKLPKTEATVVAYSKETFAPTMQKQSSLDIAKTGALPKVHPKTAKIINTTKVSAQGSSSNAPEAVKIKRKRVFPVQFGNLLTAINPFRIRTTAKLPPPLSTPKKEIIAVEMLVQGQRKLPESNIRTLHAGRTYSVGGGGSQFKIKLVRFPYNCGKLYYDGNHLTFFPLRLEVFVNNNVTKIEDCLNIPMYLVSPKKKYPIQITFRMHENPIIKLNKGLRLTRD